MTDLITLDDFKLLEGINSTANDDKFESLITRVSQLVRTYCNNDFDTYATGVGYTELFDIQWSTHVVQLKKSPVISISSVHERIGQSTAYTELFSDGAGSPAEYSWYLDKVTDSIFRTNEDGSYKYFPQGVGAVKAVYLAGYTIVPSDLQLGISDLVEYYHKDEWKERQSIGSASREGAGASAIKNDPGFPDHIRRILDLYRTS